jgi:hypothetical protein
MTSNVEYRFMIARHDVETGASTPAWAGGGTVVATIDALNDVIVQLQAEQTEHASVEQVNTDSLG